MTPLIHSLPPEAQADGVDHARVRGPITIKSDTIVVTVDYGTVDEEGNFEQHPLIGHHRATISDTETFRAEASQGRQAPETKADPLDFLGRDLVDFLAKHNQWHTQR